jgi:catechol 2,3-dioxygenase-like lactoylglutathione lyase family enzyme
MINLMDVSYVRLRTPDMESAETFATSCLGLQVAERAKKALYLRSDDRSHTLCYTEGDPADQAVGFEVEDEGCLQQAAATLERLGHRVHGGSADEAERRKVRAFIGFDETISNSWCVRSEAAAAISRHAMQELPASAISASIRPIPPATSGFGPRSATRASATGSAIFP